MELDVQHKYLTWGLIVLPSNKDAISYK